MKRKPLKFAYRKFCVTDIHRDRASYRDARMHLKMAVGRKDREIEKEMEIQWSTTRAHPLV